MGSPLLALSLVGGALELPTVSRRAVIGGALGSLTAGRAQAAPPAGARAIADYQSEKILRKYSPLLGGEFRKLSNEDALGLEFASRGAEGVLLPSGVQMIELMQGSGPALTPGTKTYLHFKLWTGGFDKGQPIDASYFDTRPIAYRFGSPAGRVLPGIDAGIEGMREGGWRRLIIPSSQGYADAGLSARATKSRLAVPPGATLYVDIHLMDAGSGKCDAIIGESERLHSMTCIRGVA